jgi:hypothetical protein
VQLERALDDPQPRSPPHPRHRVPDRGLDEPPAVRGLVHDVGELVRREHVGQVDMRAMHRGHRDSAVAGDVTRVEIVRAVEAQSRLCAALAWHDDLHERRREAADLPQLRSGEAVEPGAGATREHAGEPARLGREGGGPDGIDAQVNAVQLAACHAPRDCRVAQAGGAELRGGDQAVLTSRDVADRRGCVTWLSLSGSGVTHLPILRRALLRNNARFAT